MVEDHGHSETGARAVGWNQNLLPKQCVRKIVNLEGYVRNGLDRLGVGGIGVESHPLNAKGTGSESRHVNMKVGYVNLIRTRSLGGDSNVVITPAILGDRGWRFVVLPQMFLHSGISFVAVERHDCMPILPCRKGEACV